MLQNNKYFEDRVKINSLQRSKHTIHCKKIWLRCDVYSMMIFLSSDSPKIPALGFNCVSTSIKCHLSIFWDNLWKTSGCLISVCFCYLSVKQFHQQPCLFTDSLSFSSSLLDSADDSCLWGLKKINWLSLCCSPNICQITEKVGPPKLLPWHCGWRLIDMQALNPKQSYLPQPDITEDLLLL